MRSLLCHGLLLILGTLSSITARPAQADWPMAGCDANRSYYSPTELPNQFTLTWIYQAPAPRPAWPSSQRITDDRVDHAVIADGVVLFGSTVLDRVTAIEASSGNELWHFMANAPIRYAPAVWQNTVLVASDDGNLYALDLHTGKQKWFHGEAPQAGDWVIGNQRLMARHGARGGPVVFNGTVYYATGVWPTDGTAVYALDAESGRLVWQNTELGTLTMNQPHGGATADSGVAPQGYLAVDEQHVYVPTGRAVPAVLERESGKLKYYHLQENRDIGGSRVSLADRFFLNGGAAFYRDSGLPAGKLGLPPLAVLPNGIVQGSGRELRHLQWIDARRVDRRGKEVPYRALETKRVIDTGAPITALIAAGTDAVIGQAGRVAAIDYRAQANAWWESDVDGTPLALAFSNDTLVVSTDTGKIYGFVAAPAKSVKFIGTGTATGRRVTDDSEWRKRVASLLPRLQNRAGFAVVLDCGNGDLVAELARQTKLHVVGMATSDQALQQARTKLIDAQLYGVRATVLPLSLFAALPDDFADLVVFPIGADMQSQPQWRIVKPFGGMAAAWSDGSWKYQEKGEVPGAGSWTHQWADPGHTACSGDTRLHGRLGVAWFRDVDFATPNRHGQGPAPLANRGLLVVGGVDGLTCIDAYNGAQRWTYPIEGFLADFDGIHHDVGVGETGGRFCMSDDAVYVPWENECWKIDLETGQRVAVYRTPVADDARDRRWGVVLYQDGVLVGSVLNEAHRVSPRYALTRLRTESSLVFAVDTTNGELLWRYEPEHSVRNNAIAVAKDRVFLIDRQIAKQDFIDKPTRNGRPAPRLKPGVHPPGVLLAIDQKHGGVLWRQRDRVWGTQLAATRDAAIVLMFYQEMKHKFFRLPSEVGGRLAAFDGKTGERLWDREAEYRTHPIVIGSTIYAEGGAWDLRSGEPRPFRFARSYGCGQISASANLLLYRSATLGYWDLSEPLEQQRNRSFGGMRPSCYINAIPASGLVLVPEGSTKCRCSYQLKSWFALRPAAN